MTPLIRTIVQIIVLSTLLPVSLLFAFTTKPAGAATAPPAFVINGKHFAPPEGEPLPYINKDSRTMVPIRFFAEAMGVPNDEDHIRWDQPTQTATILNEDKTIEITLGERNIVVNGESVEMDTVAEIRDSRTFLPVRFIAEALDAKVYWANDSREVIIYTLDYLAEQPVMETGYIYDIRDTYLVYPFFEHFPNHYALPDYGTPEKLKEHLDYAREVASKVIFLNDPENERFIITIPEFDKSKILLVLTSLSVYTENPGTYYVPYAEAHPENGALFSLGIADYKIGAYTLVSIYGYKVIDGFTFGEGSPVRKLIYGEDA